MIDRLEADHANFVGAIEWGLEAGEVFVALDLFGRLKHVWWDRGREGWVLAQRVLAVAPPGATLELAAALHTASGLASAYGELEQAVSFEEQAIEFYETLDEPVRRSTALVFLGTLYRRVGRTDGRETLERGLAGLQAAGDEYGVAIAKGNLSDLALYDGDFATAALLSEQSATTARDHGFELIEAMSTCNQAVALIHDDDPRGLEIASSALRLCARTKLDLWIGHTLFLVAAAIAPLEPERAALLLGAAETELQGAQLGPAETAVHDNAKATARVALGDTAFERSMEEGGMIGREAAVRLALERDGDAPAAALGSALRLS